MSRVEVTGLNRTRTRVDAIKAGVRATPQRIYRGVGKLVQESLKREAPARTGRGRDSITFRTTHSGDEVRLRFKAAWYMRLVKSGTKPHAIWAGFYTGKSDKRFLFFEGMAHVQHPGARANDFVKRAYEGAEGGIQEALRVAGRAILGR